MCPVGGRLAMYPHAQSKEEARLVCHCLLVETDDSGLVLIDTGFGLKDVRQPKGRLSSFFLMSNRIQLREDETALRQIERLGFAASDVRHIVVTHLDFDHAGGIEDFPGATVHVFATELAAARNDRKGFIGKGRYRPAQWDQGVRWQDYEESGEGWFGFGSVRDLRGVPPEILMVPLVGHTAGHCGVAIHESGRWLLQAGDAYFHHGEMDRATPHCPIGLRAYQKLMEVDRPARLRNQQRLRDLIGRQPDVEILCSHDATVFLKARAEEAGAVSGSGPVPLHQSH